MWRVNVKIGGRKVGVQKEPLSESARAGIEFKHCPLSRSVLHDITSILTEERRES